MLYQKQIIEVCFWNRFLYRKIKSHEFLCGDTISLPLYFKHLRLKNAKEKIKISLFQGKKTLDEKVVCVVFRDFFSQHYFFELKIPKISISQKEKCRIVADVGGKSKIEISEINIKNIEIGFIEPKKEILLKEHHETYETMSDEFNKVNSELISKEISFRVDRNEFEKFKKSFREFICQVKEDKPFIGHNIWGLIEPTDEKILEYYLSIELLSYEDGEMSLDVASCMSYFPLYIAYKKKTISFRQDILYPDGFHIEQRTKPNNFRLISLGSTSDRIPISDQTIQNITLHCSLEHFEGDLDVKFFNEAFRLLRSGGNLIIIPFYCGYVYQEIIKPHFAPGCRFHRYYTPKIFGERLLKKMPQNTIATVYHFDGPCNWSSDFYCASAFVLTK